MNVGTGVFFALVGLVSWIVFVLSDKGPRPPRVRASSPVEKAAA